VKSNVYLSPAHSREDAGVLSEKAERVFLATRFAQKIEKDDFVALKIHFGEKNNTGHIQAPWINGILRRVKERTERAFLAETSTLYTGSRFNAVDHIRLAWSHGFVPRAVEDIPIIITDGLLGGDFEEVKVKAGTLRAAKIASGIVRSDGLVCLSHVTGHVLAGVGAAVKNLGMGCAARPGKLEQHAVLHPRVSAKDCRNCGMCRVFCPAGAIVQAEGHVVIDDAKCIGCGECLVACKQGAVKFRWDEDAARVQEKMAEYARAVQTLFKGKIVFVNFALKVTKDCDCMSTRQAAIVEDVGILASTDPVALDQASIDLIIKRAGKDVFRKGYDLDWSAQLRHGEQIGLGRTAYDLVTLA
jgi:uncharacterized Fe-S center protein